jgi:hypothetical protein
MSVLLEYSPASAIAKLTLAITRIAEEENPSRGRRFGSMRLR